MAGNIKGFLFDLDGTVYLGDRLIPGAAETIALLRSAGCRTAFISNKAIQTRQSYAGKLSRLGIPCRVDEVINSSLVCARYLQLHSPGAGVFAIAEQPMLDELAEHGLVLTDDPDKIEVVVVSFDRTFDYRKLFIAYKAAKSGAKLIATNPDRTCPMDGYEYPDCASMIAALEACTERKVETIVGKPSPIMLKEAVDIIQLAPSDCAMVGDRLETDMTMARSAGLTGILVMTGVTGPETLAGWPQKPDFVIESIANLPKLMGIQR